MSVGKHSEIERKYLIRYPNIDVLEAQLGCEIWEIVQTYLREGKSGVTRRLRRVTVDGSLKYFRTTKKRISNLSCEENEAEISESDYRDLCREADPKRRPVIKTRYRIPYEGHVLELDIYPFWDDRAILEIELEREDEGAAIPSYVKVIRDVSAEKAYKNRQLAVKVPREVI